MDVELIEKPFETPELKSRPGSYGKLITYAPLRAYIERMNQAFQYAWSVDVVKVERGNTERGEDEIIAIVRVTAGNVTKSQAGSKHVTRDKEGNVICLGDDTKAAISDGFKKCCQLFGIGLHLLNEEEEDAQRDNGRSNGRTNGSPQRTTTRTVGGITEKQLGFIRQLRTELEWSQEDVRGVSAHLFGTEDVTSLNATQASALITQLKKHLAAGGQTSREDQDAVPF